VKTARKCFRAVPPLYHLVTIVCAVLMLSQAHTGSHRLIQAHTGSHMLIQALTGSYRLIQAHTGSYGLTGAHRSSLELLKKHVVDFSFRKWYNNGVQETSLDRTCYKDTSQATRRTKGESR